MPGMSLLISDMLNIASDEANSSLLQLERWSPRARTQLQGLSSGNEKDCEHLS